MKIIPLIGLLALPANADPADVWEWTLESGYLWNAGDNTPSITRSSRPS